MVSQPKMRQEIIIPHDVCMSIWEVQVQTRNIWSSASRRQRFQRKIDKMFKELPNVFSIADDILVAGYEAYGKDPDKMVQQIFRQLNLKLNKDKCHFRCTSVPFLGGP